MAVEKWIAGSLYAAFTACFGSEINSLVNGNAVLSSVVIDNSTTLDIFADISFDAGASITTVAPGFISIWRYDLQQDNATYGDGQWGTAGAGPPLGGVNLGSFGFNIGTVTIHGGVPGILLPPGKCKLVLWNQAGNTLASSNTCKIRTYNRSVT